MRCPLCDVSMREVERRGVRIDVCPECRGVWLDRGELEKLLEAEPARNRDDWWEPGRPEPERAQRDHYRDHYRDPYHRDPYHGGHGYGHVKKKKSWLAEIFDLD